MSALHFGLTLTSGAVGAVTGGAIGFAYSQHTLSQNSAMFSAAPILGIILFPVHMATTAVNTAVGTAVGGAVGTAAGYFGFDSALTSNTELLGSCDSQESDC